METGSPPINEAVNLLARFDPAALERLRQQLPEGIRPLLKPGGIAGRADPLLVARAQVCLEALKVAVGRCDAAIPVARGRLAMARRLRLVGGLAGVLGSSSVLVTLAANQPVGGYVGGGVALLGSLTSFLSDFLTRLEATEGGASRTLFEVYAGLLEKRDDGDQLRAEIDAYLAQKATEERDRLVADLIGPANKICAEIRRLVVYFSSA